jgi:formate/nitrite transporter FocA (FNT family)
MELLYFYGLFAVSGAITTLITIWYPAYEIAKYMEPDNIVVVNRTLYYGLCFAFSLIMAPALIIIMLNTEAFTKQFVLSVLGKDE